MSTGLGYPYAGWSQLRIGILVVIAPACLNLAAEVNEARAYGFRCDLYRNG